MCPKKPAIKASVTELQVQPHARNLRQQAKRTTGEAKMPAALFARLLDRRCILDAEDQVKT